ncbi:flavin-containing monooxygenase [Mycobacterium avium]|uniref:flavin-containing monooxygenase n=1 Tax=Mycobacterium avium TaxID=1764 RepID=UPI0007A044EF|nr:NAD(P)/FAD-dependent oxidoreductase [Mycobacterium avium]
MSETVADHDTRVSDLERLRSALEVANMPTLLLVLAHLTADMRWLAEPYRPRRGEPLSDNDSGGLPDEIQREIREAACTAILAHERGELETADVPVEQLADMLSVAVLEEVPREYGELLAEEMGLLSRTVPMPIAPPGFRVIVIGAGMSGICMAIMLEQAGIDYVVLEKDTDLAGTWLENVYPGCGVDTPSHFYSFSFVPKPDWSRYFPKRDEVFAYFSNVADTYGIRSRIRFGTEVRSAEYDGTAACWRVHARDANGKEFLLDAPVLISAVGQVNRSFIPSIDGLEQFAGPVMHTARWRRDVDITGKRVAVIGTGASAMQLVPAIADEAERVTVFQRTKQWGIPNPNYFRQVPDGVRYLMDRVPLYARWYRVRTFWNFGDRLHAPLQIDPEWPHPDRSINATNEKHRIFLTDYIKSELGERVDLLDSCLPNYPPYLKRPLIDNGWFRTVARPDVDLVTEEISAVTRNGVVTASGEEYNVDVIAMATGFKILQFLWPMQIRGRSGQTLREKWGEDDARAYLGITVPDFPNFFIINGPNTFAGFGGSAILATELEVRYTMQAIRRLIEADLASVEVREDVFCDYIREVDAALARSIWSHHGSGTYFRNDAGRVVVINPWKYIDYWARTRKFNPSDYVLTAKESVSRSADQAPSNGAGIL